jgi:hypothetical protein
VRRLMTVLLVTLLPLTADARVALATTTCSAALTKAAPWNAVCYRFQVPSQLLRSAPFSVTDPRGQVRSLTGLELRGIYVARLGSDDGQQGHPLGPLTMVEYVFGAGPQSTTAGRSAASYVTVWEDGYDLHPNGGLSSRLDGRWYEIEVFGQRHTEVEVSTDGPRSWVTTLTRQISAAIRLLSPRPVPPLRLYAPRQAAHVAVGHAINFFILNNQRIAKKAAAFELVLRGSWSRPTVLSAYGGQACGGDNLPGLSRRNRTAWKLDFGDCGEVRIVEIPTHVGPHAILIHTYELPIGPNGVPEPARKRLVPGGGYAWTGSAR